MGTLQHPQARSNSVHSQSSIEQPVRSHTPEVVPTPKSEATFGKKVTFEEPSEKLEEHERVEPIAPEEVKKAVEARPTQQPKKVKPKPVRKTQLPKKGQQGMQPQYTPEQRRHMYLERLSRKSVKKAQEEVDKVDQILEEVGRTTKDLKEEEKRTKQRIKLINYAKFFTDDQDNKVSNINGDTKSPQRTTPEEQESTGESGSPVR